MGPLPRARRLSEAIIVDSPATQVELWFVTVAVIFLLITAVDIYLASVDRRH